MKTFTGVLFAALFALMLLPGCGAGSNEKPSTDKVNETIKAAAANEYVPIDQSPLDISYFPADYTQHKLTDLSYTAMPVARVLYSRPHRKGRPIFGEAATNLCPYGKPWRLGANEATEIEFFKPVIISGKNIAAGKYTMYAIPYEDKWIIVLNTNLFSWGLQIDPAKDVVRTEVPVQEQTPALEDFTMEFMPASMGAYLLMAWDNVKVMLPISFTT